MNSMELKNVSYRYPTSKDRVIKDISLQVKEGEVLCIIGENGAGKTTLCNVLRLLAPRLLKGTIEGEVIIMGESSDNYSAGRLAETIGFVFQNPFTQISGGKETVYDEIALGLENLGIDANEIVVRVDEIINLLNINHLKEKNPFELSGGQKQRVAIASILVMQPDILIFDEPTSQLDPKGTDDIFDIIKMLKENGKTVVLVEHKMEQIAEIADKVVALKEGQIIAMGTTKEILSDLTLLNEGCNLPVYARLCSNLRENDMKTPAITVTYEETCSMMKNMINGGEV